MSEQMGITTNKGHHKKEDLPLQKLLWRNQNQVVVQGSAEGATSISTAFIPVFTHNESLFGKKLKITYNFKFSLGTSTFSKIGQKIIYMQSSFQGIVLDDFCRVTIANSDVFSVSAHARLYLQGADAETFAAMTIGEKINITDKTSVDIILPELHIYEVYEILE